MAIAAPEVVARCKKCGREFIMLGTKFDGIDHFKPPLVRNGRRLEPTCVVPGERQQA